MTYELRTAGSSPRKASILENLNFFFPPEKHFIIKKKFTRTGKNI